jgi:hypothetical protein
VMQLTAFAAVFVAVLFSQTMSLAGLVLVSTVLQATAVFNIPIGEAGGKGVSAYGVSPYMLLAVVAGVVWLVRVVQVRSIKLPTRIRVPFGLFMAYVIVAVVGALVLPLLFDGLLVNFLLEMDAITQLSALRLSLSNVVQALNLCIHGCVLLFMIQVSRSEKGKRGLMAGGLGAFLMVLIIGLYEQIGSKNGWPSMVPYWSNNAGYSLVSVEPLDFFINRVGLPFSEPSYASVFLAATTIGFWGIVLLGEKWIYAFILALLSSIALINSLGATGLAAGGVAMAILLTWVLLKSIKNTTCLHIRIRTFVIFTIIALGSLLIYREYSESIFKPKIDALVKGLVIDKAQKTDGVRVESNKRAIEIVKETYGLGVGLGSNRASSFFASLVSNTGVLGALFFCGMLLSLLWQYFIAAKLTDMQIFVAASLPTATLAMGLGIPDLNLPMYWGFVFLGFVFCPQNDSTVSVCSARS